jgi:hypothetical protein
VAKKEGCMAKEGVCGENEENSGEKCKFAGEKKMCHHYMQNIKRFLLGVRRARILTQT